MMQPINIKRQRRRIYIFGVLIAGAAAIRIGPSFDMVFITFLAVAMALILLNLLPRARKLLETSAIGLLLAAPIPLPIALYLPFALVLAAVAYHFLHGSWSKRTDLRFALASERTAMADLPIDALWERIVPGAGHPDDYWTGTLVDFDSDPDDALTLYLRFRGERDLFTEATVSFLELEAPRTCRFLIEPESENGGEEKTIILRLTEAGEFSTIIDSRVELAELPPNVAMQYWLDDTLGDEWDGLAYTSGRAQRWFASWPWLAEKLSSNARAPVEQAAPAPDLSPEFGPSDLEPRPQLPPPGPHRSRFAVLDDDPNFEEPLDIMSVLDELDIQPSRETR